MITVEKIKELVEQKLVGDNFFIVDIRVGSGNQINVLIDKDDSVSIDDCVSLSRFIESNIDREQEDFELSVMSAGLTEPFKVKRQYIKNIGKDVELMTLENVKYKGVLLSAGEDGVELETRQMEKVEGKKKKQEIIRKIQFKYNQIKLTKLVLSF